MKVNGQVLITVPVGAYQFDALCASTVRCEREGPQGPVQLWAACAEANTIRPGDVVMGEFGEVAPGDVLVLDIPSGTLVTFISSVELVAREYETAPDRIKVDGWGIWQGRWGGLLGGHYAAGRFYMRVAKREPVTTSAWPSPVPWFLARQVRDLAAAVGEQGNGAYMRDGEDRPTQCRVAQTRMYAALFAMYPELAECAAETNPHLGYGSEAGGGDDDNAVFVPPFQLDDVPTIELVDVDA